MIKNLLIRNKLLLTNFAQLLLFGFLVLGISILFSNLLYLPKKMVKRGFEVEVKKEENSAQEINKKSNVLSAKSAQINIKNSTDIATLIASADLSSGAKIFKKCATCHGIEKGGANKVGPNLYGIIGRKKASITSFSYSSALKIKGGSWSIEDLNQWLTSPKNFVSGTKMGFAGLKKDKDRADVIAYLKQQSGQ